MEEKLTANKLNNSIHKKVALDTERVKGFFFIFLSIFKPAEKIKNTTHACIPLNADATHEMEINWLKNKEMQ